MQECDICAENKTSFLTCPYCGFEACKECYKKTILGSINKPSCIGCKKQFSNEFFMESFPKSFLTKEYKQHREKAILDQELALLPATQHIAEERIQLEKNKERIAEINALIRKLKEEKNQLNHAPAKKKEVNYVSECPKDGCRGFLNAEYECGICGLKACSKCREEMRAGHKCDENTIKTVTELKKSCRNCPSCKASIFKIEGCDQMFCVMCKTPFSWNTGKIEIGRIHNPHYFEWMRRNKGIVPENPDARRCGLPNDSFLFASKFNMSLKCLKGVKRIIYGEENAYTNLGRYLQDIYQLVAHTRTRAATLPTTMDNFTNQDLRVRYILGEITKDKLAITLQRREKARSKKIEYRQILELYCNVCEDAFNNLRENGAYTDFFNVETQIYDQCFEAIENLNRRYNSKLPIIKS